jgi:hypothetical protein
MDREPLPIDLARLVPPRALSKYAEGLQWRRVERINGDIAVYHRTDANAQQIIVPLDEKFDDYADRVVEAIRHLAEFENRPANEVLNHLLLSPADLIFFREVSPDAEAGYLPLDHAVRMLDGTRKLLLSEAHSVLVPRPNHRRMSRSVAEEFIARCRLGQTDRGSLVLTVACPLDLKADLLGPRHLCWCV